MQSILKTEIKRLIDILSSLRNHTSFDAYMDKLKESEKLQYPELKYYLEQIQNIIVDYDDNFNWQEELSAVSKCLTILE